MKAIRKNRQKRDWVKNLKGQEENESSSSESIECIEDSFHTRLFSDEPSEREMSLAILGNLSKHINRQELLNLIEISVIKRIVETVSMEQWQMVVSGCFAISNLLDISTTHECQQNLLGLLWQSNLLPQIISRLQNIVDCKGLESVFIVKGSSVLVESLLQLSKDLLDALSGEQVKLVEDSGLVEVVLECVSGECSAAVSCLITMVSIIPTISPKVAQHSNVIQLTHSLPSTLLPQQSQALASLLISLLNYQPSPQLPNGQVVIQQSHLSLSVEIVKEVKNLKDILDQDIKNELKLGKSSNKALQVWEQSADAQLQALVLLNILLGCDEDDDEDIDEQMVDDQMIDEQTIVDQQLAYNQHQQTILQQRQQYNMNNKSLLEKQLMQITIHNLSPFLPPLNILSKELCVFLHNHSKVSFVQDHLLQINQEAAALLSTIYSNHFPSQNLQFTKQVIDKVIANFQEVLISNNTTYMRVYRDVLIDQMKMLRIVIEKMGNQIGQVIEHSSFIGILEQLLIVNDAQWVEETLNIMVLLFGPFKAQLNNNQQVAKMLIDILNRQDFHIASLGLNAIFEVYSENDYDTVFQSADIINILQTVFQNYKQQIALQGDKKNNAYYKETLLNLKRFIQYKKNN